MVRKLVWVGSSEKDFLAFPEAVRFDILAALSIAQDGDKAESVKPLKGFSGASALEVIENDQSGTYRCVYTVRFRAAIYVLHAFQKKSRKGITTPREHIKMIERRLKQAAEIDTRERKGPLR